jgi:hypothetical protein
VVSKETIRLRAIRLHEDRVGLQLVPVLGGKRAALVTLSRPSTLSTGLPEGRHRSYAINFSGVIGRSRTLFPVAW